ncbi:hypothetical protein [Bacteroides pyogenes]|uniref:hypothetical protein n=1 Tax=Bacteroides pyogenes TaxID=310300 RepID=UPI001F1BCB80|nr:hypothetical protein [Bacteroides pyogenes]MCF2709467.1 hypothetical protein [Bacteroides pyogenes]
MKTPLSSAKATSGMAKQFAGETTRTPLSLAKTTTGMAKQLAGETTKTLLSSAKATTGMAKKLADETAENVCRLQTVCLASLGGQKSNRIGPDEDNT